MIYFLRIISVSFLLANCGGDSDNDETEKPQLQVHLTLLDVFGQKSDGFIQGENIEFSLAITNNADEAVTLHFISTLQYDFYIKSSSDTEIWRWSVGKCFGDALTEWVVPALETVVVTETWDQTLHDPEFLGCVQPPGGENIAIGRYTAFGSFLDQSPKAEFNFTIQ